MFSGKKPNCDKCGFVLPIPGNYDIIEVINIYGHCMTHDNHIQIKDVEYYLNLFGVETTERNIYKVVVYLTTAIQKFNEE